MKIRNRRHYPVTIEDAETGDAYEVAASPGVVDVPPALGERLLEQEDNWSPVSKPKASKAKDEPEPPADDTPAEPVEEG